MIEPPKKRSKKKVGDPHNGDATVSLKQLATHLELSTTTLSLVLNDAPAANSIPQETKARIFAAAKKLNYRPNLVARSLRLQRTHTLGIMVSEIGDNYSAVVLNGIEAVLSKKNYFYLLASHLHSDDLLEANVQILLKRQVEGLIAINTAIQFQPTLPVVNISGHTEMDGVTNITLNHERAAELGVGHLFDLGHRRIAVIKGQDFSADTDIRWKTIAKVARNRGVPIKPTLIAQLEGDMRSPEVGYIATKELLASGEKFSALFAFNDISAIGAIRALEESGFRVPADVSVLGFDDVYAASFHNPALTTIRQPLFEMGSLAATTILRKLSGSTDSEFLPVLSVEPTLIIRESTARISNAEK
jgi:DNA-binding LacI/PurR family transcriptional regulator